MENSKQQLVEKLKSANNILVTVRNNPSVDQLAACIGLTLALNKLGKHATAVYSGETPSIIEFLEPDLTLEKNTDSLRDFIIALDKSKADKLRYKVEDTVVKIFITPYKTSINQDDLEFSQGDFNVDVVVALGVQEQPELDQAITSHGRILHDATVVSVNTSPEGGLGSINWHDPNASSLSELAAEVVGDLGDKLLDEQIATALLTGIVAETERFSNDKTSAQAMTISAELMGAGANQQLVASKLEEPPAPPPLPSPEPEQPNDDSGDTGQPVELNDNEEPPQPDDGTLEIEHTDDEQPKHGKTITPPPEEESHLDEVAETLPDVPPPPGGLVTPLTPPSEAKGAGHYLTEPPSSQKDEPPIAGAPESEEEAFDPLALPPVDDHPKKQEKWSPPEPAVTKPTKKPEPEPEDTGKEVEWPPKGKSKEEKPEPEPEKEQGPSLGQIHIDEHGVLQSVEAEAPAPAKPPIPPEASEPHVTNEEPAPDAESSTGQKGGRTLADIEAAVHSPHVQPGITPPHADTLPSPTPPSEAAARSHVNEALNTATPVAEPIQALNARPLGSPLHKDDNQTAATASPTTAPDLPPASSTTPGLGAMPAPPPPVPEAEAKDPNPPPPVPPPMTPNLFNQNT